jgi:asparagine synthase (glutamine-hydrolysing)
VLLSGTGGDDLFTGYRRHQAVSLERLLDRTPRVVRQSVQAMTSLLPITNTSTRRIRKLFDGAARPPDERLAAYFEWIAPEVANDLLAEPVNEGAAITRRPLLQVLAAHAGDPPLERILRLDQNFFLTDHNLNYADKTGMAAGVEIRVPFLDPDLMAWAARIPPELKLKGGMTKYVLRKAMEPVLPHSIIYRPKTGFGVPLRAWLRKGLRPLMEDLLSPETVSQRGLFNAEAVNALKESTLKGRLDASYTLLALMVIELWMRNFADAARGPSNCTAEVVSGRL